MIASGMPVLSGTLRGRVGRADVVLGLGQDGDQHRVVVPVVAALDLEDPVAAGGGAHQVDGVHGGLGAGVAEPPQRLVEPLGEVVGHRDGVLGRLREVGPAGDPLLHRRDDRRVGVPGQRDAVPAVEVGVLEAVDVVDLRAAAVADPDRLRLGDLPVGGGASGQAACSVAEGATLRAGARRTRRSPPR